MESPYKDSWPDCVCVCVCVCVCERSPIREWLILKYLKVIRKSLGSLGIIQMQQATIPFKTDIYIYIYIYIYI